MVARVLGYATSHKRLSHRHIFIFHCPFERSSEGGRERVLFPAEAQPAAEGHVDGVARADPFDSSLPSYSRFHLAVRFSSNLPAFFMNTHRR